MAQEAEELPGYQRGEPIHDSSASFGLPRTARRPTARASWSSGRAAPPSAPGSSRATATSSSCCARSTATGVVKVYDLVRHEGQIALILEDLPGCSLRRWIESHVVAPLARAAA